MAAVQRLPDVPAVEIRRLSYPDLPQVIAIERRAFPTPWSLAMFVLELSKPSGICLAAASPRYQAHGRARGPTGRTEGPGSALTGAARGPACRPAAGGATLVGRLRHPPLIGYLICSRYETVWHIMNIAVDPDRRGEGIASALLADLYERVDDPQARYTLEVRKSNAVAIHLYEREGFRAAGTRRRYYQDNGEDALIMWRTPATLRGSFSDVPNPAP